MCVVSADTGQSIERMKMESLKRLRVVFCEWRRIAVRIATAAS